MPSYLYPSFEADHDAGRVDLVKGPLRVLLVDPAYEPQADHRRLADVAGYEPLGPGYEPGGRPLPNRREEGGYLLADNVLWPRCSVRAKGCVVYQATGDNPLVAYLDFGRVEQSVRGEFEIQWPEGRVLELR